MAVVKVEYDNFSRENSSVKKIMFDLLPNTILVLNQECNGIKLSMMDADTDNTELSGTLDTETINNLIRSLTIFKNQL